MLSWLWKERLYLSDVIKGRFVYPVHQNHTVLLYHEDSGEIYIGGTDFVFKLDLDRYQIAQVGPAIFIFSAHIFTCIGRNLEHELAGEVVAAGVEIIRLHCKRLSVSLLWRAQWLRADCVHWQPWPFPSRFMLCFHSADADQVLVTRCQQTYVLFPTRQCHFWIWTFQISFTCMLSWLGGGVRFKICRSIHVQWIQEMDTSWFKKAFQQIV